MSNQSRKVSPRSLKNLTKDGRPPLHDEKKTAHNVTVTPTAWKGVKEQADSLGCSSISELFEQIGRGNIRLTQTKNIANCASIVELIDYLKDQLPEDIKFLIEQRISSLNS